MRPHGSVSVCLICKGKLQNAAFRQQCFSYSTNAVYLKKKKFKLAMISTQLFIVPADAVIFIFAINKLESIL